MPEVRQAIGRRGALGESVLSTTRDAGTSPGEAQIGQHIDAVRPGAEPGENERGFHRENGVLRCDGTSLDAVAEAVGTPVYVYSVAEIEAQYSRLSAALSSVPHRVHYSVKANSNLAILGILRSLGSGA